MTDDLSVDVVEEIGVDDVRRQAFLRQVYDRYEQTRDALAAAKADPSAGDEARQVALANLADLLGQLRPMLEGTPQWRDVELGRFDAGGDDLVLRGLQAVFEHRGGIETTVETTTPGRGQNTVRETVRQPLPLEVIEAAINTVGEFMHENDLLVAQADEAAAKDSTPL
jgi:hypothetical protein